MTVERQVAQQDFNKGINRVVLTYLSESLFRTDTHTLATTSAPGSVDSLRDRQIYRPLRAAVSTPSAAEAFGLREGNFNPGILSLRAVAESTSQGTAFEEDYRADAGAIFETIPFDINDERKIVVRHHPTPRQFFAEGLLP